VYYRKFIKSLILFGIKYNNLFAVQVVEAPTLFVSFDLLIWLFF